MTKGLNHDNRSPLSSDVRRIGAAHECRAAPRMGRDARDPVPKFPTRDSDAAQAAKMTGAEMLGQASSLHDMQHAKAGAECSGIAYQFEIAGRRTAKLATPHARHSTQLQAKATK
jgi:hypothetical protein